MNTPDLHEQKIHRYAVSGVWGSATKSLKRGDVILDTYHGPAHEWEMRNVKTLAPAGGFKGRYLGIATCAGPGNCEVGGDHDVDGSPISCTNADCARHHGDACYTLADITTLEKEPTCTH